MKLFQKNKITILYIGEKLYFIHATTKCLRSWEIVTLFLTTFDSTVRWQIGFWDKFNIEKWAVFVFHKYSKLCLQLKQTF